MRVLLLICLLSRFEPLYLRDLIHANRSLWDLYRAHYPFA